MDINPELTEAMQMCGDPIHLPDKAFGVLLEKSLQELSGSMVPESSALQSLADGMSIGLVKHLYNTLISFSLEAAKSGVDKSTIRSHLEDCRWGPDRVEFYTNAYEEHRSQIEMELGRIGTSHPHVVDTKWRLDYYIKDNLLDKVNKPMYLISLKTQVPGSETLKDVEFACSVEQLQDLVSKLKDATKTLEKAAQM